MASNFQLKTQGLGFALLNTTAEAARISSFIYLWFTLRGMFIDSLKQELLEFPGILNLQIFPKARRMSSYAFSIPWLKIKYITTKGPRSTYKFDDIRDEFAYSPHPLSIPCVWKQPRSGRRGRVNGCGCAPAACRRGHWLLHCDWAKWAHLVNHFIFKLSFWFFVC